MPEVCRSRFSDAIARLVSRCPRNGCGNMITSQAADVVRRSSLTSGGNMRTEGEELARPWNAHTGEELSKIVVLAPTGDAATLIDRVDHDGFMEDPVPADSTASPRSPVDETPRKTRLPLTMP